VAVVLLVGGGLLLRSFWRLMSVDPGFRADHVLTLGASLPVRAYPRASDVRTFYTRLLDEIARLPGVSAAGASTELPLAVRERRGFAIETESAATRELSHAVASEWVVGRYFESLGIPLKRGRFFTDQDDASGEPVTIINETMARHFWGEADPIGKRIAWGGNTNHGPWMRIVGVVGDIKQGPLNTETVSQNYTPWLQVPDSMVAENIVGQMRSLRIAIRTEGDPAALASSVRQQVRALDPALPVSAVRTMDDVVRTSAAVQRFNAMLVGFFALLALLLAAIGVGGLLATSVTRRAQELGIRLALGAQPGTLVSMVVRDGMLLGAVGLAGGMTIAWILSRVLSALLFEVSPRDPMTFGGVAALLAVVVLIASAIPAWRATRVDPLIVLRNE
jgi:predicted permease